MDDRDAMTQRVAQRALEAADGELPGADLEVDNVVSGSITTFFRAKLGPTSIPFLIFYQDVYAISEGAPVPEAGLVGPLRSMMRVLARLLSQRLGDMKSPPVVNLLFDRVNDILPQLRRIESGSSSSVLFRAVGTALGTVIAAMGRALGRSIFQRPKPGSSRWPILRLMTPDQEQVERLKDRNPGLFADIATNREEVQKREVRNLENISRAGLIPLKQRILGKMVTVGEDPATKERLVYTLDGQVMSVADYTAEARKRDEASKASGKVFPNGLPTKDRPKLSLEGIRSLTDAQLEDPLLIPAGQAVSYAALTDDKTANQGTRIYPTRRDIRGRQVIVGGRFKGIYLDDVVNHSGRLLEGTVYDFDKQGKRVPFLTKKPDGSPNISAFKEPYVTVGTDGRFLIKLPFLQGGDWTASRHRLRKLSGFIPTVKYEDGTDNTTYTFEEKDFSAVRSAVGGMCLSRAATEKLEAYFDQIARQESALNHDSLRSYGLDRIGGFKVTSLTDPSTGEPYDPPQVTPDLFEKQKEAISWVESQGYKGVVALDTGVGKCPRFDTLIPTNRGLVQIQDMNPGLTTPDTAVPVSGWSVVVGSETLPVTAFYYGGTKPTLNVRTRNGFEIEGSLIHPVMVRGPEGEVFVKLPDLRVGDYLCVDRSSQGFPDTEPTLRVPAASDFSKYQHGVVSYPVPDRMNPDLARLLAYVIAEGCVRGPRSFTVTQWGTMNPETNADLCDLLQTQFGVAVDPTVDDKIVSSLFLRKYLEWMGVDYTLSKDKFIPPVVLQATRESVVNFIRAFVDAEGSMVGTTLEVASASERMLRELQILLLRLGVVSSRSPKKVKGRDHTYWRLTITGDGLRRYQKEVGFISSRKVDALSRACAKAENSNYGVPHARGLVEALRAEIHARAGGQGKGGGLYKTYGSSFVHTLGHIHHGRRNPTYQFLQKMLDVASEVGAEDTAAYREVLDQVNRNYFYDPIETITPGFAEVMDITVDDPRHTFIGNGLVNHNTLTAIASMMKMVRDGVADEGSRFLYVCPPNLKGNIVKEIRRVLVEPKDLLDRLDVMSYAEFRNRRLGGGSKKFEPDPTFGMNPPYAAVFFDEAQELVRNEMSANSLAAQGLNHPRKILLTASPMEDDPDQLYVGVAIANNINLAPGKRGQPMSQARKDLMRFRDRFCQRVGGRTMGLKKPNDKDPTVEKDFKTWAKQGMYFAHKRDVIEKPLPELRKSSVVLTMAPEVEALYRRSTAEVAKVFRALVSVYRDKENIPGTELRAQVGSFQMKLAKHLELLNKLSNLPGQLKGADGTLLFPGSVSPKIDEAANILMGKLFQGTRAILFTDDPKFAEHTAQALSLKFPVMYHAVALASSILFYQDGKVVSKYGKKKYKTPQGVEVPEAQWATHVLTNIVQANPQVVTLTLTKSYSVGQNLQSFSTVIHLDRDTFSSEIMKQRTARAWRTGQQSMVEEYTLDTVYSNPTDSKDATLDEIRKYIQEMQEDVFDEIVGQSQAAAIGTEWAEMGVVDASFLAVNRNLMEATMAPYVGLLADQEYAAELARDPDYNEWVASRRDEAIEHQLATMGPEEDPLGP